MRSKFNAKHLADLVEEESKLDKRRRELATELNEMQASDTAWDEPRTATYQRLQMEHAQVGRDHTSVRQDRIGYEGFAPKNAAKGSDSLVARFLLNGVNGLEAAEQKIYCEGVDGRLVGLGGMDGIRIPIGPLAVTTGDVASSAGPTSFRKRSRRASSSDWRTTAGCTRRPSGSTRRPAATGRSRRWTRRRRWARSWAPRRPPWP